MSARSKVNFAQPETFQLGGHYGVTVDITAKKNPQTRTRLPGTMSRSSFLIRRPHTIIARPAIEGSNPFMPSSRFRGPQARPREVWTARQCLAAKTLAGPDHGLSCTPLHASGARGWADCEPSSALAGVPEWSTEFLCCFLATRSKKLLGAVVAHPRYSYRRVCPSGSP